MGGLVPRLQGVDGLLVAHHLEVDGLARRLGGGLQRAGGGFYRAVGGGQQADAAAQSHRFIHHGVVNGHHGNGKLAPQAAHRGGEGGAGDHDQVRSGERLGLHVQAQAVVVGFGKFPGHGRVGGQKVVIQGVDQKVPGDSLPQLLGKGLDDTVHRVDAGDAFHTRGFLP